MILSECREDWALVTGASSGIGLAFCEQLAAAGLNLVMVARRQGLLSSLADRLQSEHATKAVVLGRDIAEPGSAEMIRDHLGQLGIKVRLLINNAAFGQWGHFESGKPGIYDQMIRLNVSAPVSMCLTFLPDLVSFRTSAVINVSSAAALQPVPYMAVYAASKAFVSSFSQALHGEWADRGVLVQTLVPGPTETEFDRIAGAYSSSVKGRGPARQVVVDSLAHLEARAPVVWSAKGTYKQRIFAGLFPPRRVIREVAKMFRPPDQPE